MPKTGAACFELMFLYWKSMHSRRPQTTDTHFLEWLRNGAHLSNQSQVLLMYGSFQMEMPSNSSASIAQWLHQVIATHGTPSLMRIGPRSRPRVFRKDEFMQVLQGSTAAA